MNRNYLRWSKVPYGGEHSPPADPVTPSAGSWSLTYLKRNRKGDFLNPDGRKMSLPVKNPNLIDFNKELEAVHRSRKNLTPLQKKIATYYGIGVPTKQWTPIIDRLIDSYGVSPVYAARILANVQMAVNDTMIVVWNLKYKWDVARPNQYDQSLRTILCTPRFPTYPSGHASMSGCAEVILSYYFPREATKLRRISEADAQSRLYALVHFPIDNDEGLRLGRYIGNVIVKHLKRQRDNQGKNYDKPFKEFCDAAVFPDDFHQFIPFDFQDDCSSLVQSEEGSIVHTSHENHKPPNPKIYL